eukprot:PhM_4_TR12999/c0_g1_i1/m.93788/K06210/NMNAT; nicotinamide mononucleotide adenylyltransferase
MNHYTFPSSKLLKALPVGKSKAVVLVACGSYNPCTMMHFRMMEIAKDAVEAAEPATAVIGGYISPVNDAYGKAGLIESKHRLEMVRLGLVGNPWVDVDDWEALQNEYKRTFYVLDHIRSELTALGRPEVEVRLVTGADVFRSMVMKHPETGLPVWKLETLAPLLDNFPLVVINRDAANDLHDVFEIVLEDAAGTKIDMAQYQARTVVVAQVERNDLSSTLVRGNIKHGKSNRYLVPDGVLEYLAAQKLYQA